ncbi:hypothetical protein PUNSTDRAFT_113056 [Punctularia strigosozonata HHB-11173 SS5]|uniref:uncharacterized protein n=1 Tax=Punctularia strigosozonata (strain HHB-11173) TaxID=741275 RepID=UPI0004417D80|nr:uncharacterized protein PUNSTDRAFT_113056 [Punctularia strigosozonata HHB-11173 SS5]EIN09616.1 hypothetical protein PUNSTDRAFT_113056 [Punctularia strigosozonata HHB-11173 SS5]
MDAFGGCNMIFAGDFAQLRPPGTGRPLYAGKSRKTSGSVKYNTGRENTRIGQALWYMVTDVVILRKNMRQTGMSELDNQYRTALENLRYKACTSDDINLIKSCIVGYTKHSPVLTDQKWRNVPIITARNAHRDKINELGAIRYAQDHKQTLIHFKSQDQFTSSKRAKNSLQEELKYDRFLIDPKRLSNILHPTIQDVVWKLPPCCTSHHAGILSLCIGMPVMLKYNEATELCATNGAEAVVVGWQENSSDAVYPSLDTLFVELKNPPRSQQLPHLPQNIIPIVSTTKQITCEVFTQLQVLLNFAMTDFCSQGRTRPINPVDLTYCSGFQSVYTCLSRSTCYDGTLILRNFNDALLTGGSPVFMVTHGMN